MSPDPRPRTVTAALVALAAVAALAACDGSAADPNGRVRVAVGSTAPPTDNPPTGPVRTDIAPLTRRFPALGRPLSARWLAGTVGDERVPGPTTYWIDAVIRLRPETARGLRETPGVTRVAPPDLLPALREGLPAGATWRGGDALDRALNADSPDPYNGSDPANLYGGTAYLLDGTDTLVLKARGGH